MLIYQSTNFGVARQQHLCYKTSAVPKKVIKVRQQQCASESHGFIGHNCSIFSESESLMGLVGSDKIGKTDSKHTASFQST